MAVITSLAHPSGACADLSAAFVEVSERGSGSVVEICSCNSFVIRTKFFGKVVHLFPKSLQLRIVLVFLSQCASLSRQFCYPAELRKFCLIAFNTVNKILDVGLGDLGRGLLRFETDVAAF